MVCYKCGFPREEKDFYAHGEDTHGNIRRDTVCCYCRREEAREYREARKKGCVSGGRTYRKDASASSRHTINKFSNYMKKNPIYFEMTFGKEPSKENIMAGFEEVQYLLAEYGG